MKELKLTAEQAKKCFPTETIYQMVLMRFYIYIEVDKVLRYGYLSVCGFPDDVILEYEDDRVATFSGGENGVVLIVINPKDPNDIVVWTRQDEKTQQQVKRDRQHQDSLPDNLRLF